MKISLQIISWLSLVVLLVVPALYYIGKFDLASMKICLNISTVVWFLTAPFLTYIRNNN